MKYKEIAKPPHGSLEWLQIRHRDENGLVRFGASEAPILMGVSKFKNIVDLAIEKWEDAVIKEPTDAMMRGNYLEPSLISYATNLLKSEVVVPETMYSFGRLIATLDGLADDGKTIVEAKSTTFYSSDDPLPDDYYWQVIAQLACYPQAEVAIIVVLDKRMRFGHWVVERQYAERDIDLLMARADEVGQMFDNREMPDEVLPTETQIKSLYPSPQGEVELSEDDFNYIKDWQKIKIAIKLLEDQEQELRDEIARAMRNFDTATFDGKKVLTFKTRKGTVRIDTKRLEQDHPELVSQYKTMGASTRILRASGEF